MCQWLYLFYTVHTCNNVLCTPTQPRANSEYQRRVIWIEGLSWWCCPWCLMLMVSLHMLVTLGWAVSIYSCSHTAERVLQRHMTLLFHFLVEQENFCMTSTEQNIVTSETSVWDKCHKCNISRHIAVPARVLYPTTPNHPGYILTFSPSSAKMDCWQGLELGAYTSSFPQHSYQIMFS